MAAIRARNTKPELKIRKALHAAGLRYRLHGKKLPGNPDLVFARRKAVIFVHGCFWHHHDCHLFKWPSTRETFWRDKIESNEANDAKAAAALEQAGWRVGIVWECAIKGRSRPDFEETIQKLVAWIKSSECKLTLRGEY